MVGKIGNGNREEECLAPEDGRNEARSHIRKLDADTVAEWLLSPTFPKPEKPQK